MPKASTQHNGQLTINYATLRQMFQIDNPNYFFPDDVTTDSDEALAYHMIFSAIKSPLAPYFDAQITPVKEMTAYVGENHKDQCMAFIEFEAPVEDGSSDREHHVAMVLYSLSVHATDPNKRGLNLHCTMNGTLKMIEGDVEFVPTEARCRQIVGKESKLVPIDMKFPNNVKASICYIDSIFRCFQDGEDIDYPIIQQWLDMDSFNEVSMRYDDLLQRELGGLVQETTNDEELDLSEFEGQLMLSEPTLKQ